MIVLLVIFIIILIYVICIYNICTKQINSVKSAKSTIDVYLTQRANLIPNLKECVKGYIEYESNLFEKVTNLRTEYINKKELKKGSQLDEEINNVIVICENYPELKANEQFINLQKNLSKMENQIQAARRIYNNEVEKYNNTINIFPNNILSKILNYKEQEYFKKEIM